MREPTDRETNLIAAIVKGGEGEAIALGELLALTDGAPPDEHLGDEVFRARVIGVIAQGDFLAAHLLPALRAAAAQAKPGRTKGDVVQKSFELEAQFLTALFEVRDGRVWPLASVLRAAFEMAVERLEKRGGAPLRGWRQRWEVLAGAGVSPRRPVLPRLPVPLVARGKALVEGGKVESLIDLMRLGGLLLVEEHRAASVEARLEVG